MLTAVVACGVDIVGELAPSGGDGISVVDGSTSSADDGASSSASSGDAQQSQDDGGGVTPAPDGGIPVPVLPDAGDAGDDAGLPPVDASSCTPNGYGCTDATTCCTGKCAASNKCEACSSTVGAGCQSQNDCCKGTWCGYGKSGPQCYACFAKDKGCNADVECCSGKCTFHPGKGPGPPGPGPGGSWQCD